MTVRFNRTLNMEITTMSKLLPNQFRPSKLALLVATSLSLTTGMVSAQQADDKEVAGLEIITVKAQKRAQNQQEVPVSMTAFSGDQMAESVIKDMYDLQTNVPGMGAFQSQSATRSSFSIRGVGTSSQNFGLESSVGLYVDGVYRARQNSLINNLVDIEAVEVLRGPQGTLFGKNTPSGAVLVRSVAPSHDGGDAFFESTVGNFGLVNMSGAASISAIDDILAFRVTAFSGQRDGIVSDINLGEDTLNDRNRWGARVQALYTPNQDVSVRIIADYSEIDEICCGAPVQQSNFMATGITGKPGSDAMLAQAFGAYIFDHRVNSDYDFYDREVALSFLPISTMQDKGLSAEITWDIDESFSIVSVSAYRNFDSFDDLDNDFSEVDLFGVKNDSRQNSFSQEVRLDYTSENLNVIVGAYYFTQELDLDYSLYIQEYFNPFYMANFNGALDGLLGGIDAISALTGGMVAPSAPGAPGGTTFDHVAEQEHQSYAVFGQFDYQLNEEFTLTAGLRFTREEKNLSTIFTENLPDGSDFPSFFTSIGDTSAPETIGPGTLLYGAGVAGAVLGGIQAGQIDLATAEGQVALGALVPFQSPGWGYQSLAATTASRDDINEILEDDQVTGTVKLSYQPDSHTMLYASYGTGYKSGGTNTDRIAAGLNPIFDAETSQSFEVGIKKDFSEYNLRINAAAHQTTVDDFQANTFTGEGFNLQNAGDYEISGFEIEATWLPMETVEVNFAYAKVDAEYKTFERGNCWIGTPWHTGVQDPGQQGGNNYCDRSGDRPAGEPKDSAVVKVKKEFSLGQDIYSYFQVEYSYTGDMMLDGSNDPISQHDAYSLVNARLFVNIEQYDMDVIFWGRNLLNEEYINRTNFFVPIQTGKVNAYVSEPATYGITVKKRF